MWSRAWELEDVFWNIQFQAVQSLDIIRNVNLNCAYLTWWYLSDKVPTAMKRCETLAHLVCHASLLMTDDVRRKRRHRSERVCGLCDMYEDDNVRHLVMQCLSLQPERAIMFTELRNSGGGSGERVLENHGDILSVLLGRSVDVLTGDQMDAFWLISSLHNSKMYQRSMVLREGIG